MSLQQAMYAEVEAAVEALQPDISAAQVRYRLHYCGIACIALVLHWHCTAAALCATGVALVQQHALLVGMY